MYLWLNEEFPEQIRKELIEFSIDENYEKKAFEYEVSYCDVDIAKIYISCEKEKSSALSVPIKYMVERLYEESRKSLAETNGSDIYRKALQFIREKYTEGITIQDVSKHIGYSESYFGYAFKKKYKMSVSRYVRELQLAKAKELLVDTALTISAVASYVGFRDSNYFTAIFKHQFGLSPKEFRKKHGRLVIT